MLRSERYNVVTPWPCNEGIMRMCLYFMNLPSKQSSTPKDKVFMWTILSHCSWHFGPVYQSCLSPGNTRHNDKRNWNCITLHILQTQDICCSFFITIFKTSVRINSTTPLNKLALQDFKAREVQVAHSCFNCWLIFIRSSARYLL